MRLAENSVQKKNPETEEDYGRRDESEIPTEAEIPRGEDAKEEIVFQKTEEALKSALALAAGKALLVSDGSCPVFADASCSQRTISVVFDGDCLPLFSMPDGVSCIFAAGGDDLLRAARYFSEVRGIPCMLFPENAALEGALQARGSVFLGEEQIEVPLRAGKIVCDPDRLAPTLSEAYARILLSRLAEMEARALALFRGERAEIPPAELSENESGEEIVLANARQRLKERDGAPIGEGMTLCTLLKERGERFPAWRAFLQLSALYAAFFEKGKPRRYFTPDYRARAEQAGADYAFSGVPSAEEYVFRAMTLERIRAPFARSAIALSDERIRLQALLSELAGETLPLRAGELSALKMLPEYEPGGLCAIIRDFGLMDWEK